MSVDQFQLLSRTPFQLGRIESTLQEVLGPSALLRTRKKFSSVSDSVMAIALREVIRYLYLTANAPTSLFFPGDQLMDDLWHSFVIETAEYRQLCLKLRPGCFLEHSGVRYENYCETKSAQQLNEEQLSWLASYYENFGPIDSDAYHHLLLAQALATRLRLGREQLNQMASRLCSESKKRIPKAPFDLEVFLTAEVLPAAHLIDTDSHALSHAMTQLLNGFKGSRGEIDPVLLSNSELESVYAASTALGFTLWQHLAAIERLLAYPEWQAKQTTLWQSLASSEKLVGLGTTHLAHAGKPSLIGTRVNQGYLISGVLPWATGAGLFDYLLLAFETDDEFVFGIIPFPDPLDSTANGYRIEPYRLVCINGSSTVRIEFNDFELNQEQIIFRVEKSQPKSRRVTRYLFPELGIADAAIRECERLIIHSEHPRLKMISHYLPMVKERLTTLRNERSAGTPFDLIEKGFVKDQLIRDAVRLLIIAAGGSAIASPALASRLHVETSLLDVLIQDPLLFERKIVDSAHG